MAGETTDQPELSDDARSLSRRLADLENLLAERGELERAVDAEGGGLWKVLDASSEAVLVADDAGRLLFVNQVAEAMFGFEKAELWGKPIEALVLGPDPENREASTKELIKAFLGDHKLHHHELIGRRKDGRELPLRCSLAAVKMNGKLAMVWYLSEISEALSAPEELRRLKDFNENIVLTMAEGIVVQDREGTLEFINPSVAELLGYSPDELIGKHWTVIVPSDQHHIVVSADERRKQREEDRYRLQLLRKDGKRVPVLVSGSPRVEGGEFVGTLAVFTDITPLEKADKSLRESEQRFRSVAESAADGVIVVDSAEHIVYWNRAAGNVFGYSRDEALGKPLSHLVAESATEALRDNMHSLASREVGLSSGKPVELLGVRKDGSEFPMALSLGSWKSGEDVSYAAIVRDATEVREAQERALVQNSLAAVGQLAAGIAHDFNNLLATIILYTEMVAREPGHSLKNSSRLNAIIMQAQKGASLTSQILDFSRRAVMERRPMNLVPFLKEMQRLLRRTLQESIRIRLEYQDQQFLVNADPGRIQQALMNLAINARDAMPSGGDLTIELDWIKVKAGERGPFPDMYPGDWVRISVSDTGIGISSEAVQHIFEPFFTTKSPGKGTGLGLAQVYGIVKQHEGYIDLTSQEGKGTVFRIYLPALESSHEQDLIPSMGKPEKGGGETILVVEDDRATREAVADILVSLNYRTLLAKDGEEALRILGQEGETIRLVLSDLVMPGIGGVELFQHLREKRPSLPMVVMTGYSLGAETRNLLDRESIVWMQKPLSLELISSILGNILG